LKIITTRRRSEFTITTKSDIANASIIATAYPVFSL